MRQDFVECHAFHAFSAEPMAPAVTYSNCSVFRGSALS